MNSYSRLWSLALLFGTFAVACGSASGGGGGPGTHDGGSGGAQGSGGSGGTSGSGSAGTSGVGGASGVGGSSGVGGTNGTGGTSGTGGSGLPCTPTEHRAKTKVCAPTPDNKVDAGPTRQCTKDADCAKEAAGMTNCFHGACSVDVCSTDADCTGGANCECSTDFYGGNGFVGNICVPATCHVDADCSGGGLCAPTFGYCGTPESFHCAPTGEGKCGDTNLYACSYAEPTGTFVCRAASTCSG